MLRQDATSSLRAALAVALIWGLRRPMTLVAFDPDLRRPRVQGPRIDLIDDGLVLVVTVIGLKVVGLVLIVALLIIPPVAARFWTDQVGRMIWIASVYRGAFGICRGGGFGLRPGPSDRADHRPRRGGGLRLRPCCSRPRAGLASALRQRHFKARVHHRQGLLALARQEPIREGYTLRCCSARA
jgi:manganese/zinc/iron transport system permease protein